MSDRPCVWIIVLGDLGRSPRMLRHAESFSRSGFRVELIGLRGREMPASIGQNPHVRLHRVAAMDWSRTLGLPFAMMRQVALGLISSLIMVALPRPRMVVVQNPPAIPVMLPLIIGARLGRWSLWIDWHNTTRSMIDVGGRRGVLSRVAGWLETRFATAATGNLAVSRALAESLEREGLDTRVLRDLPDEGEPPLHRKRRSGSEVTLVSPMSWSLDDDLDLLIEALDAVDTHPERGQERLLRIVLTGDGPRKRVFERSISNRRWRRASISTRWIPPDEYLQFLSQADVGLSLHRSSSGLDIPIKWLDITRAGIPLVTLDSGMAADEGLGAIRSCRRFHTVEQLAALLVEISRMDDQAFDEWRRRAAEDLARMPSWRAAWKAAFEVELRVTQ